MDNDGARHPYTHGDWALWHLRRHGMDTRLLQGLWSQAVFPFQCDLASAVVAEERERRAPAAAPAPVPASAEDEEDVDQAEGAWIETLLRVGSAAALRSALFIQARLLLWLRRMAVEKQKAQPTRCQSTAARRGC